MTAQQLLNNGTALDLRRHSFSSASWLSYFQGNKTANVDITFPDEIIVHSTVAAPLIRSLQRFQIGESGDGNHLKKHAAESKDPTYEQCIDLFVKEEQSHAGILAKTIKSMHGTLLSWHWSALVFVALRRALGLKTEVFMLVIAEIIGKCFYKTCADHLENRILKDTFSQLVMDEIFHLEFHCSFMSKQVIHYPQALRLLIYYGWMALFYAACLVFVADHRLTLRALNVIPQTFLKDCAGTFRIAASKALQQ